MSDLGDLVQTYWTHGGNPGRLSPRCLSYRNVRSTRENPLKVATLARMIRTTILTAVSSLLVGVLVSVPTSVAHAEPGDSDSAQTPEQAKTQLATLMHNVEIVTEQYNQATLDLAKRKATETAAEAKVTAIDAKLGAASGKVRQMVSASYRALPFNDFTSFMASKSPQDFLDQLSALDVISQRQSAAVDALKTLRGQAAAAQQTARTAKAAAQTLVDSLAKQKATLDKQVADQQTLLSKLTAEQQQEVISSTYGGSESDPNITVTGKAGDVVAAARSVLGVPYVNAGDSPSPGFDCSGLTMWAWAHAGVSLPHHAASQYNMGMHVSRDQLQPGDLVFFYSPISHVGIYIGDGKMIHAPTTGDVVKITSIDAMDYVGATRVG